MLCHKGDERSIPSSAEANHACVLPSTASFSVAEDELYLVDGADKHLLRPHLLYKLVQ